jgi:hypothetical protein
MTTMLTSVSSKLALMPPDGVNFRMMTCAAIMHIRKNVAASEIYDSLSHIVLVILINFAIRASSGDYRGFFIHFAVQKSAPYCYAVRNHVVRAAFSVIPPAKSRRIAADPVDRNRAGGVQPPSGAV